MLLLLPDVADAPDAAVGVLSSRLLLPPGRVCVAVAAADSARATAPGSLKGFWVTVLCCCCCCCADRLLLKGVVVLIEGVAAACGVTEQESDA